MVISKRFIDFDHAHCFANKLVLNIVDCAGNLGTRVADTDCRLKPPVKRYINMLIDCYAQNGTKFPPVVRRQVSPAASETDTIGSLGDNHCSVDVFRQARFRQDPDFSSSVYRSLFSPCVRAGITGLSSSDSFGTSHDKTTKLESNQCQSQRHHHANQPSHEPNAWQLNPRTGNRTTPSPQSGPCC